MISERYMYDLVVKGDVVTPKEIVYDGAVAVKDGKIRRILRGREPLSAAKTVDARGCYILPGAIDAHVHCYSSAEEGFETASRSAAAGGVTTIIEMPYDATGMICTEALFQEKAERLEGESIVDVALLATIFKEGGLDEIPKLARAGACGFKVSMFNTDSFRFPRIGDGQLMEAFSVIAETGGPVGVHAENDEIVRRYIAKYGGRGLEDPRAHCWSRPKAAESTAAVTAMELAYYTGVKLHLYHSTFPRVFELVQHYRSQGVNVTAETCTHYLTLCEDDMLTLGAKAKINPPLRSRADVEELWKLISRGYVDMVTSDHAPWPIERKQSPDIFQNASGAPGVETLLPLMYSEGVAKGKITLLDLVRLLSERPAATFGLDYCKGAIAAGMDADLAVLDPRESYVLDERALHSGAGWSPYHGRPVQGKIVYTFVRGKMVYDGQVIGQPGDGRFVRAKHH
jgi:allantoinase